MSVTAPGAAVLAHGLGGRQDLPIPFTFALVGAAVALVVSFVGLGLLWREPRLQPDTAGRRLPTALDGALRRPWLRPAGLALGLVAAGYVTMAAVFGKDDALNPTAGVAFVLLWVGVPLASLLLGPVWSWLNPLRGVHAVLCAVMRVNPAVGMGAISPRLGYWPAAGGLFAFVWLELAAPNNTSLTTLRLFFALYGAVNLLAMTWYGSRWADRGDAFDVFSALLGRLSPLGRRADGTLVVRNPLAGVAGIPVGPGLFAVVGVLLGSTAFDSLSTLPWWVTVSERSALGNTMMQTLGLLCVVALVTGAFAGAAAVSGRWAGLPPITTAGEFAHTLVPIVAGYFVAHYYSLFVFVGQQTLIQLSDPLGTGANLLGTGDWTVSGAWAGGTTVALVQVVAIVTGHLLGVVLAHDRAVALLPRRHAVLGQLPMLVLMVGYTVGGLTLLFAA